MTKGTRWAFLLVAAIPITWLAAVSRPSAGPTAAVSSSRVRSHYDAATLFVRGRLSRGMLAALDHAGVKRRPVTLVLLRASDISTCEDLGRQLRELRRALRDRPVAVLTHADAMQVASFLRRERLGDVRIEIQDMSSVLDGGTVVPSPAVLTVRADGEAAGVAHPLHFANLRSRSFAEELRLTVAPGQPKGENRRAP